MAVASPVLAAERRNSGIAGAMRRLSEAALRGNTAALYVVAEQCAADLARSATVIVRTAGEWHFWQSLQEDAGADLPCPIPVEAIRWSEPRQVGTAVFVPVRPGSVALLLQCGKAPTADLEQLSVLGAALDLALTTCERQNVASESVDEIRVLHRVAERILASRDLEAILLSITHEAKRLLAADICGILLRDGNEIVMRRCVGNLSAETAALRMRPGQGLAGRVLATGELCCVDDYVESNLISRDFFGLAQAEKVRSALGAPLLSGGTVAGVLEVWRRRASVFTPQERGRLAALAQLTSIAIDNARLHGEQQAAVAELAKANQSLAERFEAIQGLAGLQRDLVQLLINGRNLAAVAARAAHHLGCDVLIVDSNLRVLGASPPTKTVPPALREPLTAALRQPGSDSALQNPGTPICTQRIAIGNDLLGLVAAVGKQFDDAATLAIGQVATAAALYHVEQHAAGRAHAATLEALLWDLLEGADGVRQAALDRARQLNVEPEASVRVVYCSFEGLEDLARARGWGAGELDAHRRRIRELCEREQSRSGVPAFAGLRGNHVTFLVRDDGTDSAERMTHALARAISREISGLAVYLGASAPRADLLSLRKAHAESRISAEVAGQRGAASGAVFERGGVVGVLLGVRQDGNVSALVERTFGRLMRIRERQRHTLLRTLQVFFERNGSQQAAARQLRVHHKTVRYRLARIAELTGLDLARREDRVLADLALYVHELGAGKTHTQRHDGGNP